MNRSSHSKKKEKNFYKNKPIDITKSLEIFVGERTSYKDEELYEAKKQKKLLTINSSGIDVKRKELPIPKIAVLRKSKNDRGIENKVNGRFKRSDMIQVKKKKKYVKPDIYQRYTGDPFPTFLAFSVGDGVDGDGDGDGESNMNRIDEQLNSRNRNIVNWDLDSDDFDFADENRLAYDDVEKLMDIFEKETGFGLRLYTLNSFFDRYRNLSYIKKNNVEKIYEYWKQKRMKRFNLCPDFNYPVGKPFLQQFELIAPHSYSNKPHSDYLPFRRDEKDKSKKRWRNDSNAKKRINLVKNHMEMVRKILLLIEEREKKKKLYIELTKQYFLELWKKNYNQYLKDNSEKLNNPYKAKRFIKGEYDNSLKFNYDKQKRTGQFNLSTINQEVKKPVFAFLCKVENVRCDFNDVVKEKVCKMGRSGRIFLVDQDSDSEDEDNINQENIFADESLFGFENPETNK